MERTTMTLVCSGLLALAVTLSTTGARAAELVVLHADSLAGPSRNAKEATAFVAFLLTPEAQGIMKETGQPPVVPAIRQGAVPASVN